MVLPLDMATCSEPSRPGHPVELCRFQIRQYKTRQRYDTAITSRSFTCRYIQSKEASASHCSLLCFQDAAILSKEALRLFSTASGRLPNQCRWEGRFLRIRCCMRLNEEVLLSIKTGISSSISWERFPDMTSGAGRIQ